MARNNRQIDLKEQIALGFPLDSTDAQGNTLLLVACQNANFKIAKMLIGQPGVDINETNNAGNTALHFALTYEKSGKLAEVLLAEGADDMIENSKGLTPYDGI